MKKLKRKNTKDISVIVTTYNNQNTIVKTLNSIINQENTINQILVIDDNSKDKTINEIIINFKKLIDSKSLVIIKNPQNHGGPAFGRNLGLEMSKGFYIFFCDGDDIWIKNKLKIYLEIFKKNEVDAICSSRIIFEKYEDCKDPSNLKFSFYRLSKFDFLSNPIITSSLAVKKSVICRFNEVDWMKAIEDYDCWIRMFKRGTIFFKVKEPLLFYKKASFSLSSNKFKLLKKLDKLFNYNLRSSIQSYKIRFFISKIRLLIFLMHKFYKNKFFNEK